MFIYLEDVADLVDPDDLVEEIGGIISEKDRATAELVEAAPRGELSREVWDRALPQAEVLVTDALAELAYIGMGMSKPVLDRIAASHPAASPAEIEEAIRRATTIGEQALELARSAHDRTRVLECSSMTTPMCTQGSGHDCSSEPRTGGNGRSERPIPRYWPRRSVRSMWFTEPVFWVSSCRVPPWGPQVHF